MNALVILALVLAAPAPEKARQQAWRAYRLGASGTGAPELLALLQSADATVRETALDALIRIKGKVPYTALKPLLEKRRTPVLILMAMHPDEQALTEVLGKPLTDTQWTLLCNLLVRRKTRNFARPLLADLVVDLHIAVFDKGHGGGRGGRQVTGRHGDGRLTVQPGWPPRAY